MMKQEKTTDPKSPLHNSPFIIHNSSAIAVYHWRGARPLFLDLPSDHFGWLICLSFQRDGDCCFVPLAWEHAQQTSDDQRNQYTPLPPLSPHAQSHQQQSVTHLITTLQQEGWHLQGRLTLHFTGHDTTPDFNQQTNAYLWQTPITKDEL